MALTLHTPFGHIPIALNTSSAVNPISGSFTIGANTKAVVVMIFYAASTQRTGGAPTFGAETMTQLESLAGVTEAVCEMWWLPNPSTSGSWVNVPNDNTRAMWVNMVGIDAASGYTVEVDDTGINETTAANPNVTVVTTVNNALTIACVATGDNTFSPTARRGTVILNWDPAAYGSDSQYLSGSATGTLVMTWTEATSDDYGAIGAAFKEVLGTATLAPATSTQLQTSGSVALTEYRYHLLTVSDAIQLQTAETLTLTAYGPTYTLIVQDASQLQTSENIILTARGPPLVMQDAVHAQTSENVILSAHYAIVAQNAQQAQTSENVSLSAHYSITVQNAQQAQTSDKVVLSAHYSITIQNAQQAQTSSQLTILNLRANGARNFNGTTDRIDWNSIFNPSGTPVTISIWMYLNENHATQYFFNIGDGDTYGLWLSTGAASGVLQLGVRGQSTDFMAHITTQEGLPINKWLNIVATYNGTYGAYTNIKLYINGIEGPYDDPLSVNGATTETQHTGSWSIGGRIIDDARNANGRIGEVAVWDRVLNSSEIALVSSGSVLKSGAYVSSGLRFLVHPDEPKDLIAGTLGTLDGTSLAYGPDLDFPDYSLTVQDAIQAQTSENTILSAHYSITVQNASQTQTADNITLTQYKYNILIVQNAIQAQTSGNVILSAHYAIIVNDAIQLITSDNVSIGGGGLPIYFMHYKRLRSR